MQILTPPKQYGAELLDGPSTDPELVVRTIQDIVRSNTVFQGTRAVVRELALHLGRLPRGATLLDVGTGAGDVPAEATRAAARRGISLEVIGLDAEYLLARQAMQQLSQCVCASGLALPFADASVDVVMCSQMLHHFQGKEALLLLREMNRVSRIAVVVSDLRRSWIAAAGFWAASFPLAFHSVTRHDGVLSVMRGFTPRELADTVSNAVGIRPAVHQRIGFRVTTSWSPVDR